MKKRKLLCVITLAVIPFSSLNAAEWLFDVLANPTFGYNDNVFLQEDESDSFNFRMTPTAVLSREVENMKATLNFGYNIQRYFSEPSIDATNPFVELDTFYQLERMTFGLNLAYKEDLVRNEALEDTGDFSSAAELRRRSIRPVFSYKLSEIDSLTAEIDISETEFSTADFADNDSKSYALGWQRQFTERFSGGVRGTISNFEITNPTSSSDDDNYNVSLTSSYQISEIWSANASLGFRRLESTITNLVGEKNTINSTGSTYQISSQYSDGNNNYSVDLSRQVSPGGVGQVIEQERLGGNWSRQLSERLSSNLSIGYQITENASGDQQFKRKNLDFSPSLRWQLSSRMQLDFRYDYRQQKLTGPIEIDANSNSFSVNLNYDWDGIRASR